MLVVFLCCLCVNRFCWLMQFLNYLFIMLINSSLSFYLFLNCWFMFCWVCYLAVIMCCSVDDLIWLLICCFVLAIWWLIGLLFICLTALICKFLAYLAGCLPVCCFNYFVNFYILNLKTLFVPVQCTHLAFILHCPKYMLLCMRTFYMCVCMILCLRMCN